MIMPYVVSARNYDILVKKNIDSHFLLIIHTKLVCVPLSIRRVHFINNGSHEIMSTLYSPFKMFSVKNSEEKSKKAISDATRLAEELRTEQEHGITADRLAKSSQAQCAELQVRKPVF